MVSPNVHRNEEGRKKVKGLERTRAPGKDQLHLKRVVRKQEAVCMTWSHVYKAGKDIQICLINLCAYMYTHVPM